VDRAEEDGTGQWPAAGIPGQLAVASYLTAPSAAAAQYRLIVDTLLDEQSRTLAGVPRPDLAALLRGRLSQLPHPLASLLSTLPLDRRLDQLVAWGVVVRWTAPSGDPVYQLTVAAAQLHQAVRHLIPTPASGVPASPVSASFAPPAPPAPPAPANTATSPAPAASPAPAGLDQAAGSSLGASVAASAAPPVLAAQLARLSEAILAGAGPGEPAVAAEAWSVLRTTFAAMTEATANWRASLAAAQAGAADPARIAARQEALRRDADVWGTGVDRHGGPIATHTANLLDAGPVAWRPAALHSLGAAVPEDRLTTLLDDYRATLTGLLAWFGPGDNAARQLRRQLRDVLVPRGAAALAGVRGQLTRRTDLLTLAGALERSATDDGAWSLWCAATGLFSGRHLPHPSPQPAGPAGTVSFWAADPAPAIQSRLTGHPSGLLPPPAGTEIGDQVARLPDRSAARAAARAAAAAHQAVAEQTQQAIRARSGLRLSGWTGLDAGQFDVLLSFLAVLAGARPGQDGTRTVRTPDGRWTVRAEPAPDDAPPAVIRTQAGHLVHPDLRLTITAALPAVAGSSR
jgi:uncharacterized protein (TIGR02677 family)